MTPVVASHATEGVCVTIRQGATADELRAALAYVQGRLERASAVEATTAAGGASEAREMGGGRR